MVRVLIVAEHDGENLNPSTAKCVTGARGFNPECIDVGVFAENGEGIAAEAAKLDGVTTVIRVDNPASKSPLAAVLAPQIVDLASSYTHVVGPSTTFGKGFPTCPIC